VDHSGNLDEYIRFFAQAVRCAAGTRGIVYLTVSITSGRNLFLLMDETGIHDRDELKRLHRDRYEKEVVEANLLTAVSWSAQARSAFPGRVVLDPSPLDIHEFRQEHYYQLWENVIRSYADTVIATPHWAFSTGSRKEVEYAIKHGLNVVDMSGTKYDINHLEEQDESARRFLLERNWNPHDVARLIPKLNVGEQSANNGPEWLKDRIWEDVIYAVENDLLLFQVHRHPPIREAREDDILTRDKGLADGWKDTKLKKYWDAMLIAGRAQRYELAKIELLSLAAVAVSMLRSTIRCHGTLPTHTAMKRLNWQRLAHPALETVQYDNQHYLTSVNATTWTWLREEYKEMRTRQRVHDDEENLRDLWERSTDTGGWNDELWNLYFQRAQGLGMNTWEGRVRLGQFTLGVLRMLESTIRLYGPLPTRTVRDTTREHLQ
jgi:hypothetical protein